MERAPADLGKPADGTYLVEHRRAGASEDWTETRTDTTTATLTDLTNGQAYEVQVTAYNDHGGRRGRAADCYTRARAQGERSQEPNDPEPGRA